MAVALAVTILVMVRANVASSSSPACGVRGPSAQIIRGEDAGAHEFPWMVSLNVYVGNEPKFICGGSIINEWYIITAAQCVQEDPSPSRYRIGVGGYRLSDLNGKRKVSAVTIPPNYDNQSLGYDYALLKLETPLDFYGADGALKPICLPEEAEVFDNQTCTVTGWGTTSLPFVLIPEILQKLDVLIVPPENCNRFYPNFVKDTMICVRNRIGTSPSTGDAGGPLQCARKDGRYVLAGTVSFTNGICKLYCPTVFAQISTQLDWIASVVGATP